MAAVTPPPPSELNRELDVLLATEDNTVREEANSLLAKNNARVASERLTNTDPNGAEVYDGATKTIDGHVIKTSATPPLRNLLSTPELPEEFAKHLPAPVEDDEAQRRSALTRLAVIACAVVVFGTIARATKQTRADAAALKRLDELDPHGFLREQWEFKPKGAGDGNRDDATRSSDAAVLSPHCEASLAAHLPLDEFSLSKTPHDTVARSRLYSAFARSVRRDGLTLFDPENAATQGLAQGSLFRKETSTHGGVFVPILTRLDTPVRAIVVPLPAASNAANTIYANTKRVLEKYFPSEKGGVYDFSTENHARSVWLQDPTLYHFSTFHASHHLAPIPLGGDEGEADVAREVELNAVRAVARHSCPIDAVIERVVVTPSGVVMALWNIEAGVEPRVFRDDLARALPNAPAKQIVKEKVIWHSTVARVLAPPNGDASTAEGNAAAATNTQRALTEALCGVKASLPVAWFVEEFDVLALALGGRFDKHDVPFQCQ